MGVTNVEYDVPSTAETLGMFFVDIILFTLLAFYFDHVDQSNQGKSYDFLFFLKKSYWLGSTDEDSKKIKETIKLGNIKKGNVIENASDNISNRKTIENISGQKLLNERNENEEENLNLQNRELKGVNEEKEKIIKSLNTSESLSGLKIIGCGKTYDINNGICRTKKLHALKEVRLLINYISNFLDFPKCPYWRIIYHFGA